MEKELTKIKNALHCLKVGADLAVCEDCDLYPCDHTNVEDIARVAIKALEKQIPKKPSKLTDTLLIETGWAYKCPTCGLACGENKYHLEVTEDEFYCTQCGQKLDWD